VGVHLPEPRQRVCGPDGGRRGGRHVRGRHRLPAALDPGASGLRLLGPRPERAHTEPARTAGHPGGGTPTALGPKMVAGPPKRFAQAIGVVFSTTALVLWFGFHLAVATWVVVGLLATAATLESALGICLGCIGFGYLMKAGIIPRRSVWPVPTSPCVIPAVEDHTGLTSCAACAGRVRSDGVGAEHRGRPTPRHRRRRSRRRLRPGPPRPPTTRWSRRTVRAPGSARPAAPAPGGGHDRAA